MKKITAWILCLLLVFSIAGVWAFWASSVRVRDGEQNVTLNVGSTAPVETQISLWNQGPSKNDNNILVPMGGAIHGTTAPAGSTVVEFVMFPIVVYWNKLPNGQVAAAYDASLEGLVGQFLFEIDISLEENDNNLHFVDDPDFLAAEDSIFARLLVVDNEQDQNVWSTMFTNFEQNFRNKVSEIGGTERTYTYSSDIDGAIGDLGLDEITEHYTLNYWHFVQLVLVVYLDPPTELTIQHIVNAPVLVKISVSLDDDHEIFANHEETGG